MKKPTNRRKVAKLIPLMMFGTFTRAWRTREKLSQEQFARKAGVDLKSLQQLENGIGASLSVESLFAIAAVLDVRLRFEQIKREPPKSPAEVLEHFDQLVVAKRGRVFVRNEPDREHSEIRWDVVGDPANNWLFVVVSNPRKKIRFGTMTTEPGGWSIAGQVFGIDAETHSKAEELSGKLWQEHKAALLD